MTGSPQRPPSDDDRIDADVFHRYVTGAATREETAAVDRWAATPTRRQLLIDARGAALQGDTVREERVWAAIVAGIEEDRSGRSAALRSPNVQRRTSRSLGIGTWLPSRGTDSRAIWHGAVGAVLATFLLIGGWTLVSHAAGGHGLPPSLMHYTTASDERGTITLTDGTIAKLNVASRLEIPADYASGNHTVRLVGEALFTVSHHEGMPFTVMTGPTTTRVLGTSFLVRRYATDTTTTVAVEEGKVAVGDAVVTASRYVEVGRDGVAHGHPIDAARFGFSVGVLVLPSMRLAQAIPELDRWYNADIRLGDTVLAMKPVKGDVSAGSLTDLTELLTATLNVRVVRDGRVLTLYPR